MSKFVPGVNVVHKGFRFNGPVMCVVPRPPSVGELFGLPDVEDGLVYVHYWSEVKQKFIRDSFNNQVLILESER